MDGRALVVLALGLACGGLGCVRGLPTRSEAIVNATELEHARPGEAPDRDLKNRPPKATTCLNIGHLREAAAQSPDAPPAYRELMREEARRAYQRAIELDPNCTAAYVALARLYDKTDDHERALALYQKVLKKHPKDAALCIEVGMSHCRFKEWEAGLGYLRRACEMEPENRQYAKTYGFALARAGRADEAVTWLSKAMSPAEAHCNVARMLHHMEQNDRSREFALTALSLDPNLAAARELLAELDGGRAQGAAGDPAASASAAVLPAASPFPHP
ncbi:MAG: tetratricopeptide repeat protein [Gemmataceae bacterium]|nr:tetratricopeptide repeat protein [Gemmataceae bacterium]MDW8266430.1 tetratricopeptide repeat protein [Gemmataceae bacterium]